MIYDELDYKEEADIFANQQKFVKPLSAYDIFKANLESGNDDELLIKAMVESYGLTISNKKNPGTISAVGTLVSIYKEQGYQILDRTLRLCIGAWEGDINSLTASVLRGIMQLVITFGDTLRDELFIEKVGNLSQRELVRTARERRGLFAYAETMLMAYNNKMKSPLHQSELYSVNKKLKQNSLTK